MFMYNNKNALTLVELIVVITILVILATIGYIYFDGNLAGARDAKRNTDINQIVGTLELFETEK